MIDLQLISNFSPDRIGLTVRSKLLDYTKFGTTSTGRFFPLYILYTRINKLEEYLFSANNVGTIGHVLTTSGKVQIYPGFKYHTTGTYHRATIPTVFSRLFKSIDNTTAHLYVKGERYLISNGAILDENSNILACLAVRSIPDIREVKILKPLNNHPTVGEFDFTKITLIISSKFLENKDFTTVLKKLMENANEYIVKNGGEIVYLSQEKLMQEFFGASVIPNFASATELERDLKTVYTTLISDSPVESETAVNVILDLPF